MKDVLKKHWFISAVIGIIVVFGSLLIYSNVKDKLPGKKVDGKDVVAVFNNQNIFADDVFAKAKESNGGQVIPTLIFDALFDQAVETTDAIKKEVATKQQQIIDNFKNKSGDKYQEEIGTALKQLGYSNGFQDLAKYVTTQVKSQTVIENYILANKDKYFTEIDSKKGRVVSHILVKYPTLTAAEKEGKTAEEITKLQNEKNAASEAELTTKKTNIDKELETKAFDEVASQHSEDEASKVQKGSLGYVNSETSFVKEFLDAALALNEGEVSGWIKTQYGYHKIKVDLVGAEKLIANSTYKTQILNAIIQQHKDIYLLSIKDLATKFPIQSEDPTVKKIVEELFKE